MFSRINGTLKCVLDNEPFAIILVRLYASLVWLVFLHINSLIIDSFIADIQTKSAFVYVISLNPTIFDSFGVKLRVGRTSGTSIISSANGNSN